MVEDIHKLGKEKISEIMGVEEMVTEVDVTLNQARTWIVWMIEHNVMPFLAKMRQRHPM